MASATNRFIGGAILLSISLFWFLTALTSVLHENSFVNTVGAAVPFVLVLVSMYLVSTGSRRGPLRVILSVAVCGVALVIGGAYLWAYYRVVRGVSTGAPIMSVWASLIVIGMILVVGPVVVYRAKTR